MDMRRRFPNVLSIVSVLAALLLIVVGPVVAQQSTQPAEDAGPPPLKREELEQLLAPIALYPDSLLSQMLMASTYPLEIVQAERWAKQHKDLKDAALTAELEKQPWDPSVRSLVNFPEVLAMMSEKLDLTMKLGDAFIAQQADVMRTIQNLRAKAQAEGNLKSNEQQKVVVEPPPAPGEQTTVIVEQAAPPPTQIIKIEPAQPEVIYVPSYSPTYVYGGWPYPSYPPAPYYPPGYVASNMISFGVGVACGAAWGYAWGNCNWGGNDVDIDIDRNTNINNNIDRSKYKAEFESRQTNLQRGEGGRAGAQGKGSWSHNPQHRQGVPYRDNKTAQQFGGTTQSRQAAQARQSYSGRAEAGRQDLTRGGAGEYRGSGAQNRAGTADRAGSVQDRAGSAAAKDRAGTADRATPSQRDRSASSGSRASTFDGVDRGGSSAKASSQRGQTSRSNSSYSQPSRSSGSRSYGGGSSRGGGGGRGGGGRR
jgi:hypothetical protein